MKLFAAAILATALALPHTAHAWGVIASAGAPDETCTGRYSFSGTTASVGKTNGVCTLRYPVQSLPDWEGWPHGDLNLNIIDTGDGVRVLVRLMHSGSKAPLIVIDSDDYRTGSKDWRYRHTGCFFPDFKQFTYWIEVDLIRSDRGGKASIGPIGLRASMCDSEQIAE